MDLTNAQLKDLAKRSQLSALRGYTLARGSLYAEALGVANFQGGAGDLMRLSTAALAAANGEKVEEPTPEPVVVTEAVETKQGIEAEVVVTPQEGDSAGSSEEKTEEKAAESVEETKSETSEGEETSAEDEEGSASDAVSTSIYAAKTNRMLREECESRGLEVDGKLNKAKLVALLEADDAAKAAAS